MLKMSNCTKSHFGNMLSTYMFPPDAALPQVFDKTKEKKIIHKDMKDSWNSVLDLLVYSKCPIKWNSGPRVQNNSLKTLTLLDDGMSCSGWHRTFCIAVNNVWNNSNVLSGVWHVCQIASHTKYPARICLLHFGKYTKFEDTIILSTSNYFSLGTLSAAIKTVVSAYYYSVSSKW